MEQDVYLQGRGRSLKDFDFGSDYLAQALRTLERKPGMHQRPQWAGWRKTIKHELKAARRGKLEWKYLQTIVVRRFLSSGIGHKMEDKDGCLELLGNVALSKIPSKYL